MPCPLMVIKLTLHPFRISHLFLNVKWNLPHLKFDFSTLPSSIGRNCRELKCEIEMRPAPPHLSWLLDTDLNSKLCWPQSANQYIYIWAYRLHLITYYLQQSGTIYTIIYLSSKNRNSLILNSVNLSILGQVAKLNSVYNLNL